MDSDSELSYDSEFPYNIEFSWMSEYDKLQNKIEYLKLKCQTILNEAVYSNKIRPLG
jgi:hypothetical protein